MARGEDMVVAFMEAVGNAESGGRYSFLGGGIDGEGHRPRGKYQIMSSNWVGWAADAGISGADWRDPAAQDRVAKHKMLQYYRQYGDWRLVALAWFGGPEMARQALDEGMASVSSFADNTPAKRTAGQYVADVTSQMGEAVQPGDPIPRPSTMTAQMLELQRQFPSGKPRPQRPDPFRKNMIGMLDALSNKIAGGQRSARGRGPRSPIGVSRPQLSEEEETP